MASERIACKGRRGVSPGARRAYRRAMSAILNARLDVAPWSDPRSARLPGIQPLDPAAWLLRDDAFAPQMAERDRLLAAIPGRVHAMEPRAEAAAEELRALVLEHLRADPGYDVGPARVTRPDGVRVARDGAPLMVLGRLVQEDLCVMLPDGGGGHVLAAAVLCFPASWTLEEKMGRALIRIHAPVAVYDADLARRVQRLFDALHPERPLWRANALGYADPALHQPRREADPRPPVPEPPPYIRAERQCLLRLPESGAVVFSIHTQVVRRADTPGWPGLLRH